MNAIQRRIADAIAGLPRSSSGHPATIGLRNASVFVDCLYAQTRVEVARKYSITPERARQIVNTVRRVIEKKNSIGILRDALADLEPVTEPEDHIDDRANGLPIRGLYENDGMFGTAGFKRKYYERRRNQTDDCA